MSSRSLPLQRRFQRFECKYLITEQQAWAVRRHLLPYVVPDVFAEHRPDHSYSISSLYFDSVDLRLYRETIEGNQTRYKLRVRTYSDDPTDPVFIEIKERHNSVIRKVRCPVSRADFAHLVVTGSARLDGLTASEIEVVEQFRSRLMLQRAVPVVQIGYTREAWMGRDNPAARVTFDRAIRSRAANSHVFGLARSDWDIVEGRQVVLEMKFNERCPSWIHDTIERLELRRRSYSKYAHAIEASRIGVRLTSGAE